MSDLKDQKVDQYQVLREIGRGGMGVVYEAEEIITGRRVALKMLPHSATLDPQALRRFQREMRTTARLNHPNILKVYRVGAYGGRPYYAMEYVEGISMAQLIRMLRQGSEVHFDNTVLKSEPTQPTASLSEEKTVLLAEPHLELPGAGDGNPTESREMETDATEDQDRRLSARPPVTAEYYQFAARSIASAAEALDHAHRHGVIHRDVKPSNILFNKHGEPHLSDFGLAVDSGEASLTVTGAIVGTPRYMSPEQLILHRVKVDARTDVYSLGVTLYELLTLLVPFAAPTREKLLVQIATQDIRAPRRANPHTPADLQTIAMKAMERSPDLRYQSAQLMADDLRRFLAGEPILAEPPSPLRIAWRFVRKHRTVCAAGLAAAVFLTIGAAAAWQTQKSRAKQEQTRRVELLTRQAREAESEGKPTSAADLYTAALALQPHDAVLAADLSRVKADLRAYRHEKEIELRRRQADEDVLRAIPFLETFKQSQTRSREAAARMEQIERDLAGVLPSAHADVPVEELEHMHGKTLDLLEQCRQRAREALAETMRLLHGALTHDPKSTAARTALADLYCFAMLDAEANRDWQRANFYEHMARLYHDGQCTDLLSGKGSLNVTTQPPHATCRACRYVESDGCLDLEQTDALGVTPIENARLRKGSYLLVLSLEGYGTTHCPVLITRGQAESVTIPLLREGDVPDDLVYVPPGHCLVGGDPDARYPLPAERLYVPGFLIGRTETTCAQYETFLQSVAAENPREVKKHLPRTRNGQETGWQRDENGKYVFTGSPTLPVQHVTAQSAVAYCEWLTHKTGRNYRLPTATEWEKAARGADGRTFPWGNRALRGLTNVSYRRKAPEQCRVCQCGLHIRDRSPYGAMDMAGNVSEICADIIRSEGHWTLRGGRWYAGIDSCRLATRSWVSPTIPHQAIGFRVVCDVPGPRRN